MDRIRMWAEPRRGARVLLTLALLGVGTGCRTPSDALDAAAVDAATDALPVTDGPVRAPDGAVLAYAGPDDWCPGSAHCTGTAGDNQLSVGAGRASIDPDIVEGDFQDLNGDGEWQATEPYTDTNHNGRFDAVWIAGFGNSRPARGIHDALEVRAVAFKYNDTTVVLAVLDCVGFFLDDMDRIRARPELRGLDIDRVIVGSTHVHEAVDTVGMWGPDPLTSGQDPVYMQRVYERAAQAIRAAVTDLRPARMRVAQTVAANAMNDTMDFVNDTRDPVLYDPTITVVRFTETAQSARTIATLVNFAAHPEFGGSRNNQLSADYVHNLRKTVEEGVTGRDPIAGVGGTTVFVQGALGGQVGPGGGVHPPGSDGVPITESGLAKADAEGVNLGRLALRALADAGHDEPVTRLEYRTAPLRPLVRNVGYHALYYAGVFRRDLVDFNPDLPAENNNLPRVISRITYLQVGPVATITAPGELHPELWVGYDLRWSWGKPVLTETRNRPDLSRAPAAPYLRDLVLQNDGVRYAFVSGLTEDFLGYIVARFNFVLHPTNPYLDEPDGDHYEETNSIGPESEEHVQQPMMALTRWRIPASR